MNYTDFLTDRPVTYRDMQLEQLRQKYAGMAMQAIISNPKYYKECINLADEPNSGFMDSSEAVAFWPVIDPDIPAEPYCRKCLDKIKADTIRTLFGDVFDKHNDCERKTCRTCKHRERWALSDWSKKVVQCCNLQPSKRSNSGYKTIKAKNKACENYEQSV